MVEDKKTAAAKLSEDQNGSGVGMRLESAASQPAEWLVRLHPRASFIYTFQNRTVLATGRDGFIDPNSAQGLWYFQTRVVSRYRWLIDLQPPRLVAESNVHQHSWLGYYIAPGPGVEASNAAQQTIELRLARFVAEGMHEDVQVTNFTRQTVRLSLALEIQADFADHAEAGGERRQQGRLREQWRQGRGHDGELDFDYQTVHRYAHQGESATAELHRSVRMRVQNADSRPGYREGRVTFGLELPPRGTWRTCILFEPTVHDLPRPGVGYREPPKPLNYGCHAFFARQTPYDERRAEFLADATYFSNGSGSLEHVVLSVLERSRRDLIGLRLYDLDQGKGAWTPSGGLPMYIGLFGRDSLASSWEASLLGPEMLQGALATLPRWQGDRLNDWRDEQPGRFPHEAHTGPLAALNFTPHGLYYGGVTGPIYYPTLISALWHWTGEKALVQRFIEPALRGLEWADRHGDLDGDGFVEYRTLSKQGEKNQGWKDSEDAIIYEDGTVVEDPLGTCEMQALTYASKLHLSEVLWWLDMHETARRLFDEAEELRKRFNEHYWMEDQGYVAMALDARKRKVRSIASDPGHCLASGIIDTSRVERVAARMLQPDLFSGWGVRTLSAEHPAFNPYAYHRGTVWPVENGVFALGFARYGMHERVNTLCKAMFEAASLYDYCRLPECFGGHPRDEQHPFPGAYPNANWPQAWSASAPFALLQAMLGLYPYAPLHTLLLDPLLPEWLPAITLHHLRIGRAAVTIRFYRTKEGSTDYEVIDQRGKLHVVRQPSPQSLTAGYGERVRDLITSLLPGR